MYLFRIYNLLTEIHTADHTWHENKLKKTRLTSTEQRELTKKDSMLVLNRILLAGTYFPLDHCTDHWKCVIAVPFDVKTGNLPYFQWLLSQIVEDVQWLSTETDSLFLFLDSLILQKVIFRKRVFLWERLQKLTSTNYEKLFVVTSLN